jgi:polyisoprenoid-binding protein YceI
VSGEILAADTVSWREVRGRVIVRADKLVSGDPRRDAFTNSDVLDASRYPEIRFTIDSLADVRRDADTIVAKAIGVFTIRGVAKPMTAGIRAWPEARGLRATAKFHVPAEALTDEFGISKFALGLGVRTSIWHHLFMGVDVILRVAPPSATPG